MKKSLFLGMAAMLVAGLSSCSNDDLTPGSNNQSDVDRSFFVNINIASADALTRADGGGKLEDYGPEGWDPSEEPNFDAGNDEYQENEVKTIFLIFYDEEGNRVYTTQVRKDNDWPNYDGRNPSENSLYKGIVQIDVKHGSNKPKYVMCFVNPITSQSFEMNPEFATLESLQQTTRPKIIDDNGFFAMSKSVYYGVNRAKPDYDPQKDYTESDYEKIVATPIPDGQLFDTYDEAEAAIDADTDHKSDAIVDIYVERYAAKVNFSVKETAQTTVEVDGVTLTFVPEYWAVNAYENETYICKSFLSEDMSTDLSYVEMSNALKGEDGAGWFWNSPTHHRCYWAQTPAYYKKTYPRVADDLNDLEDGYTNGEDFALGYYSYDQMQKNANASGLSIIRKARDLQNPTEKVMPIYARENTVAGSALQAAYDDPMASPKAAVASIVLVGHYELDGETTEKTFYVMGNSTNGYTLFKSDDELIPYMVNTTVKFAKNTNGDPFFNYALANYGFSDDTYEKYFVIQHPEYNVRSYGLVTADKNDALIIDSRFVTVQLDKEKVLADGADPIWAYINGKYQRVTADNIDFVNQQMLYQAGTVQGFQGGKAYFNIPIQHLGYYRTDNPNYTNNKSANDKDFDWKAVHSGDFGLVRNHVYTIQVENIKGLGNGIPNPYDPIVPPTDPEEYYIGARIIVLNWALVPTQNVTL